MCVWVTSCTCVGMCEQACICSCGDVLSSQQDSRTELWSTVLFMVEDSVLLVLGGEQGLAAKGHPVPTSEDIGGKAIIAIIPPASLGTQLHWRVSTPIPTAAPRLTCTCTCVCACTCAHTGMLIWVPCDYMCRSGSASWCRPSCLAALPTQSKMNLI